MKSMAEILNKLQKQGVSASVEVGFVPLQCETCEDRGYVFGRGDVSRAYICPEGCVASQTIDREALGIEDDPAYLCDVCQDTGHIMPDYHVTHPEYGKMVVCPQRCAAVKANRQDYVQRMLSGMQNRTYRRKKLSAAYPVLFEDYKVHTDYAPRRAALSISRHFVKDLEITYDGMTKKSLVLQGPTGTGKTLLASAIANELVKRDIPAWFCRVREVLKSVQAGYSGKMDYSADDMIEFYCDFPVLILDEFNINFMKEDRKDIMEDIIDYRYRNDMPTVVTLNLAQDQFAEEWGERTQSRLVDMALWTFIDQSIRDRSRSIKFNG